MRHVTAANLALILVPVGWALAGYGMLSTLGDPSTSVSRAQLEAMRHLSISLLLASVLILAGVLWLSGYAYRVAKVRAGAAAASVIIPLIAVIANLF